MLTIKIALVVCLGISAICRIILLCLGGKNGSKE